MSNVAIKFIQRQDIRILIRTFTGEVSFKDIIASWDYCINEELLAKDVVGCVSDFRAAQFVSNPQELEHFLAYMNQQGQLHHLRLAVLVDTPDKIVFPMIGESKLHNRIIKPFSTEEAAVDWVAMI